MTDQPKLTKRQEKGLRELLDWDRRGRSYQWMPTTMRELRAMGYVTAFAAQSGTSYGLTESGRVRARELTP